MERVEGTAEYTGIVAASPERRRRIDLAQADLRRLTERLSFSRSFAYSTAPAYGLLLDQLGPDDWHQRLLAGATFDGLLAAAIGMSADPDASKRALVYGGASLAMAEHVREATRARREAALRASFVDGPVLIVPVAGPIGFDPGNVTVLDGAGTVYVGLKTTGPWGGLEATGPALVAPDWSTVRVAGPITISGNHARGPNWQLTFNAGWTVAGAGTSGDLKITRTDPEP